MNIQKHALFSYLMLTMGPRPYALFKQRPINKRTIRYNNASRTREGRRKVPPQFPKPRYSQTHPHRGMHCL